MTCVAAGHGVAVDLDAIDATRQYKTQYLARGGPALGLERLRVRQ